MEINYSISITVELTGARTTAAKTRRRSRGRASGLANCYVSLSSDNLRPNSMQLYWKNGLEIKEIFICGKNWHPKTSRNCTK